MKYAMLAVFLALPLTAYAQPPQAPPAQPSPMPCEEARGHLSALYEQATAEARSFREQAVIAARKLAESEKALAAEAAKHKPAAAVPQAVPAAPK